MTTNESPIAEAARRVLFAVATTKVVLAAIALIVALDPFAHARGAQHAIIFLAAMATFAGAAMLLLFFQHGDRRAVHFGGFLVLCAAAFSDDPLRLSAPRLGGVVAAAASVLVTLHVVVFLPLLLWLFARDFPQVPGGARGRRVSRWFVRSSQVAGGLLFTAAGLAGAGVPGFASFSPESRSGPYWAIVFTLALPALVFTAWRAGRAAPDERRRVAVFVAGLVLGFGPMVLEVLAEIALPAFRRFMDRPGAELAGASVIYPALLSIPITTTYAVLVHRVLDLQWVLRAALRYALARYTVIVATALPFIALVAYVWGGRGRTVAELMSAPPVLGLGLAVAAGAVGIAFRRRILDGIDRRFFREQYDAYRILTQLAERTRAANDPGALADLWIHEIDRALHLESIAIMVREHALGRFVTMGGVARPLATASSLATLLSAKPEPMDTDLSDPRSPLRRLPEDDRAWLGDGGFRLLTPLVATDGTLLGIIALGAKRNETRFSDEDRGLLASIAAAGSLALENRLLRSSSWPPRPGPEPAPPPPSDAHAVQCAACGRVSSATDERCPDCGGLTEEAPVPAVLHGKFRIVRCVGKGGMGAVYRAEDLALGVPRALKVLPRVSPEDANGLAMRLRDEARAMAVLSHPNLALIHGVETWMGSPILVLEFLEGGTLADRLSRGRFEPDPALELLCALASVLERVHSSGYLHRDIKPSNIGFTGDGTPKLLDFGLARLLPATSSGVTTRRWGRTGATTSVTGAVARSIAATDHIEGTPLYLSPEAYRGARPDASFDLWSLAVVFYEVVSGVHPFRGTTRAEIQASILFASPPDVRDYAERCPASIAEFLATALAAERRRRPASARAMREELERLRASRVASGAPRP